MVKAVLLWLPLMLIGLGNGVLRGLTYGRHLRELHAHQISSATAIVFIWLAVFLLLLRFPIRTGREAWRIGGIWVCLTIAFEFVFGRFVAGHDWARLFRDYDLFAGRLWSLVLLGILLAPVVARWLHGKIRGPQSHGLDGETGGNAESAAD